MNFIQYNLNLDNLFINSNYFQKIYTIKNIKMLKNVKKMSKLVNINILYKF